MSLLRSPATQLPLFGVPSCVRPSAFVVRCSGTAPQPNELRRNSPAPVYKKGKVIPQRLAWPGTQQGKDATTSTAPNTVYTLRFRTGYGRASGLSDPYSHILVCLVGKDGTAVLRRVSPVNDPEANEAELLEICSIADRDVGADCSAVASSASLKRFNSPSVKPRFQPGSIDEVSFLAPELGPLASVMMGTECGSWQVDEVMVSSSRSHHTDRFVSRECLGTSATSAAFLTPVPPGAVVYGSGESATILTKEQAAALHTLGMMDYGELKDRLMLATSGLVLAGSGIAFTVGGWDAAAPFLAGGVGGLFYCWLLQQGVDSIPAPSRYSPALREWAATRGGDALQQLVGSTAFRFAALTALALGSVWAMQLYAPEDADMANMLEVRQVLTGILGFLMWKLALVGVTSVPAPPREPAFQKKSHF